MKKFIQFICSILFFAAVGSAQNKEAIRVGVYLDMSGQTSYFGDVTFNGIKLAVDEINASGGIDGRRLEIFLEDDKGNPENAAEAVQKLIAENQVHAIVGDVASSNSLAGGYVAQKSKIPMITPSATNPKVTQVGDYIFCACFVDPFQGEAMARFAFDELKAKRVAIMDDVNSDYSKGLAETFTKTFTQHGGKIIVKETYSQTDPDFKIQLKAIRKLKPDAIYLPGYYGQVAIIARQARDLKMNIPLLGGDGWDSPELWKLGGDALNNSYITNQFANDSPTVEAKNFVENFQAKFKSKPGSLGALGYDTIYILAEAIRRAKTTDGEKLRDAIAETKNFSGVTGNIRFNESQNAIKAALILKSNVENTQFIYYSTIKP